MNTYFIRTVADDYPQLIAIGVLLGAIVEVEGQIQAVGGAWDYIGPICEPRGDYVLDEWGGECEVFAAKCDPQGREYIHINIITPINLREAAVAMATAHPEVAEGLANLGKFFLLDAEGNARAPDQPYRVFAS
jgi:predicted LPLAT superfamily acyltransferase